MCECSACLYVNILCIYLVPKEVRELPGIRDMKNCETSCRLGTELGNSIKAEVFLNEEPSLQFLVTTFLSMNILATYKYQEITI